MKNIKTYESFKNIKQDTFKPLYKSLYKDNKTGKEHSLKYDELDQDFAKWLRLNYYNVKLSNIDVDEIKKNYEINKL